MPIGTTLEQLVLKLRGRTRQSMRSNVGVDVNQKWRLKLREAQEDLYLRYDWRHLRADETILVNAGQRYYDFPAGIHPERVTDIAYHYSNGICSPDKGIGIAQYREYDPALDERSDPVQRWDVKWTGTETQLEIWPLPTQNNIRLQFFGIRPLMPLVDDNHRADLDDNLIVAFAAAEILAEQGSKDANLQAQRANRLLLDGQKNSQTDAKPFVMGRGSRDMKYRQGIEIRVQRT